MKFFKSLGVRRKGKSSSPQLVGGEVRIFIAIAQLAQMEWTSSALHLSLQISISISSCFDEHTFWNIYSSESCMISVVCFQEL